MISGWGRYPRVGARLAYFETEAEAQAIVVNAKTLIPQGMARSYGDAALSERFMLSTRRFNRLLSFDENTGHLRCQSGVTIADIMATFVPRGWFVKVSPGTKFVTIGGAIAADVHGKNHHKVGSFSVGVEAFDLLVASGEILTCSRDENSELFWATLGGMGLTGLVTNVTLKLDRIPSAYAYQRVVKCQNLDTAMDTFEENIGWTHSVAWIDCLASGVALGRSVVFLGEMATPEQVREFRPRVRDPFEFSMPTPVTVPFSFPNFVLNGLTMRAFNATFFNFPRSSESVVDLNSYNYPLDRVLHWNRLYGSRGFFQYQCVLPLAESRAGYRAILEETSSFGVASFLAVLKLFGKQEGMLSFPMEGYTLTMDFPVNTGTLGLAERLDRIVEAHGGRLYLAKDARQKASSFARMQRNTVDEFTDIKAGVDPQQKFASLQSDRLGITS